MDYDDITYFCYYGGIVLFSALVEWYGRQAGAQLGRLGLVGLAFYCMMAMSWSNGTEIGPNRLYQIGYLIQGVS
jgi:hypothetical protein